jgi:hypothetical protein
LLGLKWFCPCSCDNFGSISISTVIPGPPAPNRPKHHFQKSAGTQWDIGIYSDDKDEFVYPKRIEWLLQDEMGFVLGQTQGTQSKNTWSCRVELPC